MQELLDKLSRNLELASRLEKMSSESINLDFPESDYEVELDGIFSKHLLEALTSRLSEVISEQKQQLACALQEEK